MEVRGSRDAVPRIMAGFAAGQSAKEQQQEQLCLQLVPGFQQVCSRQTMSQRSQASDKYLPGGSQSVDGDSWEVGMDE